MSVTENAKILIVDDIPSNITVISNILNRDFSVKATTNGKTALKIINSETPPDMVLLDVMMPEMDGYEVCRQIKANPDTAHIPVIFITAQSDTINETHGFVLGASDYISKPVNSSLLLARVKTHLALSDINRQLQFKVEEQRREIEKTYTSDTLTGLTNLRGLINDLDASTIDALFLININRFHAINEYYGYGSGDGILIQMGEELQNFFSEFPVNVYHTHGSEFAVALRREATTQAPFIEETHRFIAHMSIKRFPLIEGKAISSVPILITAGLAFGSSQLLSTASQAIHNAKNNNLSYVVLDAEETQTDNKNITVISNLFSAIEEDRIATFYQPIIDNRTGEIYKYEALIRMINRDGEVVSPSFFLEISKKARLYPILTKIVHEQTCSIFKNRTEKASINIGWEDISSPVSREAIKKRVSKMCDPSQLTFELVETELLNNDEASIQFLQDLKAMGCKLAIDDFGSGYSNFEYLLRINADFIKIDGSLIEDIDKSQEKRAIVKSIITFAHEIGVDTIAEFVSSEAIFKVVKEMGITYSQGSFFSKPAPKPIDNATPFNVD